MNEFSLFESAIAAPAADLALSELLRESVATRASHNKCINLARVHIIMNMIMRESCAFTEAAVHRESTYVHSRTSLFARGEETDITPRVRQKRASSLTRDSSAKLFIVM